MIHYNYNEDGINLDKLTRQELRELTKKKESDRIKQNLKDKKIKFDKDSLFDMFGIWKQYKLSNKDFISVEDLIKDLKPLKGNIKVLE